MYSHASTIEESAGYYVTSLSDKSIHLEMHYWFLWSINLKEGGVSNFYNWAVQHQVKLNTNISITSYLFISSCTYLYYFSL